MLTAIIVAGGSSRRMGFDKLFANLAGVPVIAHTIAAFERSNVVDEIIVVGRADRLEEIRNLAGGAKKLRKVVEGGVHRQDSVNAGLQSVSAETSFVAVHDAARPLVTAGLIERVFAEAKEHGAAAAAAPVTDTLKRAGADHIVSGSVDRSGLFAMQTPQIFSRELLLEAYRAVAAAGVQITDEVSAIEFIKRKVVLVPNEESNPKITFPTDLALAEYFLANEQLNSPGDS